MSWVPHKIGETFKWIESCEQAFEQFKIMFMTASVLAYPNPCKLLILNPDNSNPGTREELS